MRAKDIVLLGFVNAASEFVKENSDKADLIDLSNEELNKIKDSFSNLDFLDSAKDINELLMAEGKKYFNQYIENKLSATKNILSELGEIFDVDFDENTKAYDAKEEVQEDTKIIENEDEADVKLSELLKEYDTSEDIAELEEDEEPQEDLNEPEIVEELKEVEQEIVIDEEALAQIAQEAQANEEESGEDFGISDDDEYLNQIAIAAAKSDEELKNYNAHLDADTIISDIISHEKEVIENQKIFEEEINEEPKEAKIEVADVYIDDASLSLSKRLRNIGNQTHYKGYILNPLYDVSEEENIVNNSKEDKGSLLSGFKNLYKEEVKEEIEEEPVKEEPVKEEIEEEQVKEEPKEEVSFFAYIENPGVDAVLADEEVEETSNEEALNLEEKIAEEEVFIETPKEELTEDTSEEEVAVDVQDEPEKEETIEDTKDKIQEAIDALSNVRGDKGNQNKKSEDEEYVDSLISDLKEKIMNDKTVQLAAKEESKNEIYARISKIYANLSDGFIRSVYDLKEPLAKQYALGEVIIVLHRAHFSEIDHLREFVEVMMSHNYSVNVDEKKMIVDTFKEFTNTDGKILTNIFEVANQAKVLNGNYEGYRVIKREEM